MNGRREDDISLLYIEDETAIRKSMFDHLNRRFERVWVAENGAEGLAVYREKMPDIVLTDLRMPVMGGLEMARAILELDNKAIIIIISAHNEPNYLLEAIEMGVNNYLLKPLDLSKLNNTLQRCIEHVRKARSTRDHEKSIAEAYQRLNALIECNENRFIGPAGLNENLERQFDLMIETFLRGTERNHSNKPARIMTVLAHDSSLQPEWTSYEMGTNGQLRKACFLDQLPIFRDMIVDSHALYYFNEGDCIPNDQLLRHIVGYLIKHGSKPRNMVWYCNGNRVICAVNYPSPVRAPDTEAVLNLSMHARYLDMLLVQHHQTEEAFLYTITSLARAAEANDEDNGNHILRVGTYSAAICRQLGFSERLADTLDIQSQLHDVGKIHVLPEILRKPGKLTDAEMALMQDHTIFGAKIIGVHPRLEIARSIALHHHEHWDGSGYPAGLAGAAIPMDARIVAIADVYDALRNRRTYKPAFDHDTACRMILEGDDRTKPSHFDPMILDAFKGVTEELGDIYDDFSTVEDRVEREPPAMKWA